MPAIAQRADRSAVVSNLQMNILTGRDDLRDGSVAYRDGSVAYAEIRLSNGRTLPRVNLNSGGSWGGNSTHSVSLPLPTGTKLEDIATFTLSHDGAARRWPDGYDNWNVDSVRVTTPEVCSSVSLANPSGRP